MTSAKRAVLTLRSFTLVGIPQQREAVHSLGFWRARSGGCRTPYLKRSAREPRQGGSDYRCCIPALAGFVSPRSIAPDGEEKFAQDRHRAIGFENRRCAARSQARASGCFVRAKWLALLLLVLLQCSCTTLANRRGLYSPEPAPDAMLLMTRTTATRTTQMRTGPSET